MNIYMQLISNEKNFVMKGFKMALSQKKLF